MNVHVKMPKESAEKMLELKSGCSALAAMPQLVGASSRNQKAVGSTPALSAHPRPPVWVPTPGPGAYRRQPIDASPSHQCFSPFLSLLEQWKKCPQVRIKKSEFSKITR